jgi:effector-binding domain-containing protein
MQYQIGDFSRISRLSVKTLRFYHECGLLEPKYIEKDSGYRFYDGESLERARIINSLKELDFALKDIKEMLDHCGEDSELLSHMVEKHRDISRKITDFQEMQRKLEVFIQQTTQEEVEMKESNNEITIKTVPEKLIASVRFKGRYQEIGNYLKKLYKACGRYVNGNPFSLYYDNEYKDEDADMEICLPVKSPVGDDEVGNRVLAASRVVAVIHIGPYETIGESYKVIFDNINSNKLQVCGPVREVYLKGPGLILPRSPKKFATEIQMPMPME